MFATTADLASADKERPKMSMKFKRANGRVVYLPTNINCNKFRTVTGDDDFFEKVECLARKTKAECKTCSLNKAGNSGYLNK